MSEKSKEKRHEKATGPKPIRLLPGIIIAALLCIFKFVVPIIFPEDMIVGMFGGVLSGLAIIVWWAFFSRAPGIERWGAVLFMVITFFVTRFFLHESIAQAGMGVLFPIYAIPIMSLTFVVWAIASRQLSEALRRITMIATILLSCGVLILFRYNGITADGDADFSWRWAESAEDQLLALTGEEDMAAPEEVITEAEWPGFRGPDRDGIVHDLQIETDWTASPPVELWRRPIGPGWSSFAVSGNLFYTQEQRGEDEAVSCYNINSGKPVWRHLDKVRFWEAQGGAGPRGTPTLSNGRVYTLGATGILNVLNAGDGSLVWSRNVASDTDTELPMWAFASSPLVLDNIVIVQASGALVAYDLATGEPRWFGPVGKVSYSSPHLMTVDGVTQVLQVNGDGAFGVKPTDGTVLWEHVWPDYPIVQPAMTADGDILISVGERSGLRRISVSQGSEGWTVEEIWTSTQIKPYFNDSVVHEGYIYGFFGRSLVCIDVEDGTRKWKGGIYGRGQCILLADQDLILVLSEKGELALVEAVPDQFTELVNIPAIEGKTWNHPVLVNNILLIRNGAEMVAYQLSKKLI